MFPKLCFYSTSASATKTLFFFRVNRANEEPKVTVAKEEKQEVQAHEVFPEPWARKANGARGVSGAPLAAWALKENGASKE